MASIAEICKTFECSKLKKNINDFVLVIDNREDHTGYLMFHYENNLGWKWRAQYDKEVEDYTVKLEFPLFIFNDISFIRSDYSDFTAVLSDRYEISIMNTLVSPEKMFTYGYTQKQIHQWEYAAFLPATVEKFKLDIVPDKAIRMINGSYIIAEYALPEEKTGLLLSYNVLREEFFAELYKNGAPIITHALDVRNIPELESALQNNLRTMLLSLT